MTERPDHQEILQSRDVIGVVLAGGRSRRMGTDKAMLKFCGVPFIRRVASTLQSVFPRVVLSVADPDTYGFLGLPRIVDEHTDCGPLAGIHAALNRVPGEGIFVLPCDAPFISHKLIRAIMAEARSDIVTIARDGARLHPLIGFYPSGILPAVSRAITRGALRMTGFLAEVGYHAVDVSRFGKEIANINRLEDINADDA